jgi:hypothetical protein
MVSLGKAILFGFLVWVITFVVAFAISPIRESWRALFESIMPVVLATATVFLALRYLKRVRADYVREGVLLGLLWLAINIVIDLPLMLSGPMKMSLGEYLGDIALTYVLIPVITLGLGVAKGQAVTGAG